MVTEPGMVLTTTSAFRDLLYPCGGLVLAGVLPAALLPLLRNPKQALITGLSVALASLLIGILNSAGMFTAILSNTGYHISHWALITGFSLAGTSLLISAATGKDLPTLSTDRKTTGTLIGAGLLIGAVLSILQHPCTGQVYLSLLSMVSSTGDLAAALPQILVYHLIMTLPILAATVLLALLLHIEDTEPGKTVKRGFNATTGLIFYGIALFYTHLVATRSNILIEPLKTGIAIAILNLLVWGYAIHRHDQDSTLT